MRISRFGSVFLLLTIAVLLLSACAPSPSASISAEDKAEIYAAVVKKLYGGDPGAAPNGFKTLYIAQTTKEDYSAPAGQAPAVLSSEDQQKIGQKLSDLPTQIIWVKDYQDIPWDKEKGIVKDGGAGVTLGKITFQSDGKLQVAGGIYYGNLGAHGSVYTLEKIEGKWTITGHGPEGIS